MQHVQPRALLAALVALAGLAPACLGGLAAATSGPGPDADACSGHAPEQSGCTLTLTTGPFWRLSLSMSGDYQGVFSVSALGSNGGRLLVECGRVPGPGVDRCQAESLLAPIPAGVVQFSFYAGVDSLDSLVSGAPATPRVALATGSWAAAVIPDVG